MTEPDGGFNERTVVTCAPGIAEAWIGEVLVLAHEGHVAPAVLDPIAATIWGFLDGRTPLGAIVEDLADAFGVDTETQWQRLCWLVRSLQADGFVAGSEDFGRVPRSVHPRVDVDSCLGRRLGLVDAQQVQVQVQVGTDGARRFRLASTDHDGLLQILDALPSDASVHQDDDAAIETLVVRITVGRRPRLQQLFDSLGNVAVATRDLEAARSAVDSAVAGLLLEARDSSVQFVACPALRSDAGVLLLHPALRKEVTGLLRAPLAAVGVDMVGSYILPLLDAEGAGLEVMIPHLGDVIGGERLPVLGIASIAETDIATPRAAGGLVHVLRRWNQAHLDLLPALVAAPRIDIPREASPELIVKRLAVAARGLV